MPHAEVRQRVHDRVLDGRRRPDRARLADPLRAERVDRSRRLHLDELERRQLGRRREQVPDEARRQRSALLVVGDFLEERLRHAGGDATVHLALSDERVDDVAGIVHGDETKELDGARLRVHLDDGEVRPERKGRALGLEVALALQIHEAPVRGRALGQLSPRQRGLRSPGDMEAARVTVEHDVLHPGFEHVGGQLPPPLDDGIGGLGRGGPTELGRLRARTCPCPSEPRPYRP